MKEKRQQRIAERKTPRYALRFAVLLAVFLVIFVGSFPVGRYALSVRQIFSLIASRFVPVEPCWPAAAENVIFEIRFPRVAAAALIGAALSLAGTAYQGMFRNPMVSPDILGASTGAGFGAAIAILLGADYFLISASSFGFGLLAVLAAYLLSRCSKTNPTLAMILSGMMISSLFQAGTSLIKLVADTQQQLPAITYWLMGSLSSIKIEDVKFLCIPVALGALPLFILSWRLNLLTVGDEEARTLGVNTTALRDRRCVRHAPHRGERRGVRHDRLGGACDPALLPYDLRLRLPAAHPGKRAFRRGVSRARGRRRTARHNAGAAARHSHGVRRRADLCLSCPDGRRKP